MVEVLLTKSDDGRTIEATVGDSLVIELPENPTTGYRWIREPDSSPSVRLRANTFNRATGGGFGAPGVRHLEYEVVHIGDAPVELHYRQAWEDERAIADTFSVVVVARD